MLLYVYTLCAQKTQTKRDTLASFWHIETWVVLNIEVDSIYTQYVKTDIYLVRLYAEGVRLKQTKERKKKKEATTTSQDRKKYKINKFA